MELSHLKNFQLEREIVEHMQQLIAVVLEMLVLQQEGPTLEMCLGQTQATAVGGGTQIIVQLVQMLVIAVEAGIQIIVQLAQMLITVLQEQINRIGQIVQFMDQVPLGVEQQQKEDKDMITAKQEVTV